ncbi:CPBP family intramembrane glutamic endopeptidase [Bifidobacterium thermophilum]|uniref:CPBP family intramembrane glutamic endopeptidase n=1 Tax=Bifidobacterium thermophilum TaxID=33905 RepID=UPI0030B128CF
MSDQSDDADNTCANRPEHVAPTGQQPPMTQPPMTQPQQTARQEYRQGNQQSAYSQEEYQPAAQSSRQPDGQPADCPAEPYQAYQQIPQAQQYQQYQPYQQVPPAQANAQPQQYPQFPQFPQPVAPAATYPNPAYPAQMQVPPYPYQPYPYQVTPPQQYQPYPPQPYQPYPYPPQAVPPYQQVPPYPYPPQPMPQAQQPAWIPRRVLTYAQQVRRAVGREARLVLFYCVVMTAVALVAQMTIATVMILQGTPESEVFSDAFTNRISGAVSLIALVGCAIYLALMRSHDQLWHGLPHELRMELTGRGERVHRKMTPVVFLLAIMLILGASDVYTFILEPALDWLSGLFGFQPSTAMDSIDASMGTLAMVLYAGFFGPIMEELLFRGLVMPALAKYGKVFSIVTSAVLFGFFHTDLLQGTYAILVGLVLGYIAAEYGLVWSIALHITNNFVFSDLFSRLLTLMPENAQNIVGFGLYILVGLGSLLYLVLRFRNIREYMKANRSPQGTVAACWSSPWFLVFLGLSFLFAFATGFTAV